MENIDNEVFHMNDEVCFIENGKKYKGKIIDFLTIEQKRSLGLWGTPLKVETDEGIFDISEYQLIEE